MELVSHPVMGILDERRARESAERLAAGTPTDFFSDEVRSVVGVADVVAHVAFFARGGGMTVVMRGAIGGGGRPAPLRVPPRGYSAAAGKGTCNKLTGKN